MGESRKKVLCDELYELSERSPDPPLPIINRGHFDPKILLMNIRKQ